VHRGGDRHLLPRHGCICYQHEQFSVHPISAAVRCRLLLGRIRHPLSGVSRPSEMDARAQAGAEDRSPVAPADVRTAAERIRPLAKRTPVMTSASFNTEAGASAFFKCENLQTGGAFKIRGASNLILSLPKDTVSRGVVAY